MRLSLLVHEYEEYQLRMNALTEATTLRNYIALLKQFVRWIDECEGRESVASDLTDQLFVRYVDHVAAATPKSAQYIRAAVRSFCKYLIRCKWLDHDITKDVELPTVERSIRTGPEEKTIKLLLEAVDSMKVTDRRKSVYRAVLYLLVFAGLRKKEVFDLRVEDIRMAEREVFVRLGKGNSSRIVKCPDEFWPVMGAYLAQRPSFAGSQLLVYSETYPIGRCCATGILNKIMAAAGMERGSITPHCLRHAFATRAANNNAPLTVVQAQLGHSKITTTAGYIHAPKKISSVEAQYFGMAASSTPPAIPTPEPPAVVPVPPQSDAARQRRRIAVFRRQ